MNWHLSTGRLSTIYPFQLQTPLHRVSPLPHLFTPFASQSQFTFHIVPLLGDRRKPLKLRSVLLRIPNGPSLTPRPLRSTVREFLSQRHPASSPSSVPKAGGRSDRMLGIKSEIRTPGTPNAGYTEFPTSSFRHPGTCHRKAMVAPSPNGAITGLTACSMSMFCTWVQLHVQISLSHWISSGLDGLGLIPSSVQASRYVNYALLYSWN